MNHLFVDILVMLAELTIKPEALDRFIDYTRENLTICRSYPGNIEFDILIDESCPTLVRFYEVWETVEAQQAYLAWRIQAGDLATLLSFLVDKPKFTALRSVAGSHQVGL